VCTHRALQKPLYPECKGTRSSTKLNCNEESSTKPWNGEKLLAEILGKESSERSKSTVAPLMSNDTYGFPLNRQIAAEHGLTNTEGFEE